MKFLTPPKKPLLLGAYLFAIFLVVSLAWGLADMPSQGTDGMTIFLFVIVGFFYGKYNGVLSFKKAALANAYVAVPLVLLKLISVWGRRSEVPSDKAMTFMITASAIVLIVVVVQVLINAVVFYYMARFGASNAKPATVAQ